jgi:hypothetical protein
MDEEWGPWTDHDGKGCPVPTWTYVQAEFSDGDVLEGVVDPGDGCKNGGHWNWKLCYITGRIPIIRYRIRKPRGMTILKEILAEVENTGPKVSEPAEREDA